MLDHLKDGPKQRTSIMTTAATSWKVYSRRLEMLSTYGLIEELDDMDKSIALTDKGREFLNYYDKIVELFPKE